ncbi:MAG: hypothetical protein K6A95_04550 [Bacteroidales bacterium]|nr:hypothetical protein [Bacteroidales bacterium]
MSWLYIILLISFGLLAVIIDFLFIPGGIVAVIGLLMEIAGIVGAYATYGTFAGTLTLLVSVAVSTLTIVLILRSKTWKKCALDTAIDNKVNDFDDHRVFVGAVGRTISRLAPTGKAVFDGETVEVASSYGFIDQESDVVVEKIEGSKIFVKLNK